MRPLGSLRHKLLCSHRWRYGFFFLVRGESSHKDEPPMNPGRDAQPEFQLLLSIGHLYAGTDQKDRQ